LQYAVNNNDTQDLFCECRAIEAQPYEHYIPYMLVGERYITAIAYRLAVRDYGSPVLREWA
jgi:hypothetical protein